MPELPEVETTRRGIEPHVRGQGIGKLLVRERRLRWPVPACLQRQLPGQRILSVGRRGKYLLLETGAGSVIVHLGMSGSLRLVNTDMPAGRHDHIDLQLKDGRSLRYTDPRRFGTWLWGGKNPSEHPLIAPLGPEPLEDDFNGDYLFERSRGRRLAVKNFLMNSHVVVGVGNIYANEALFRAGVHPSRAAGRIGNRRYRVIVSAVREVLASAIEQGGTTLRDFVNGDGKPGYFQQSLKVYGRTAAPCPACGRPIKERRIGQRSSFYCPGCQH